MTAINPFVYTNSLQDTFYFVSDLPHLGFIHLSKLSPDELKAVAQAFNLVASKANLHILPQRIYFISGVAVSIIGALGLVLVDSYRNPTPFFCCLGITCFSVTVTLVNTFNAIMHGNTYAHNVIWRNYALEMLDLKLGTD